MTDKYKHLEGAVNVNGDQTPITRKPIEQLDSSEWHQATTTELLTQREALQNRIDMAMTMGRANLVPVMQQGLILIDTILIERAEKEGTKLV